MDRTDVILVQMLLTNSRTPYRELAEKLDLSVNAVHKRIQSLIEGGIICKFTAKASLKALGAFNVVVFGSAQGRMDEISAELGKDERVYWVSQAGGGMIYVGAYLNDLGDLNDLSSLVRKKARMDSPTVGIMAFPPMLQEENEELTKNDCRIINALKDDSRKAVSDVAEELSTSAKTVRRRLDRMMENGLIECSLEWYPDASNDIISMFHMRLDPSVDLVQLAFSLMKKHSPNALFFFLFSNLPDTLLFCAWSSSMKDLNKLRRDLDQEAGVITSIPNILYTGKVYETWRDDLIRKMASSKR